MDAGSVVSWLVEGTPGARTSQEVLAGVCERLRASAVPVDRAEAFVRTLHPHIVGRSFAWRPGEPVEVRENSFAFLRSDEFLSSPVPEVFETGEWRRRLDPARAREGYTDLIAAPFRFLSGQVHAITFATRRSGGFSPVDVAALEAVVPPLTRIAEILALSRTAVNLLNTYVGHDAGERILSGKIQRGDVDSLHAVIWFSDLRGFTQLSASVTPGELIAALNDMFECQVGPIEEQGGEVLKFMGDGLLAMFRTEGRSRSLGEICDGALLAAKRAFASLHDLSRRRADNGLVPLRIGVALHIGEVAYGNIGGAGRLDFTCIGPAVNLAARLEGVASKLGRTLVTSAAFAASTSHEMVELGDFELKGVSGLEAVYAPQSE